MDYCDLIPNWWNINFTKISYHSIKYSPEAEGVENYWCEQMEKKNPNLLKKEVSYPQPYNLLKIVGLMPLNKILLKILACKQWMWQAKNQIMTLRHSNIWNLNSWNYSENLNSFVVQCDSHTKWMSCSQNILYHSYNDKS